MESENKTSDIDSDGEQITASFSKLSLDPPIDTDKENEVIIISQASNHKQREKLAKLLKRYTENKEELIRNTKDLYKVSSILRREKRQTICFEEYSKLDEQRNICEIINKNNYIDMPLPQEINTMMKLSKYSVEELNELSIDIKSNCENEHENIEEFLLSFGSTQIEGIIFKGPLIQIQNEKVNSEDEYYFYLKVFPCSSYFYCLRVAISKATRYIRIYRILFSSEEFSAILRAAKQVKELDFVDCKILTDDEHELGQMEGCQMEILQVADYIHAYKHLRNYNNSCMKIFLSILGCPNLLKSLKQIRFDCQKEMKKKLLSKSKKILGNDYEMLMPRLVCFSAI